MELMKLRPIPKRAIWGKNEVGRYFGYADFPDDTGQTWCVSAHEEGSNQIADGPHAGMTLKELWETHHDLFQTDTERFPWIIGLVGPSDDLSVQVHPDDAYTIQHHLKDSGKNEGWYFFKTAPKSRIVYGHTAETKEQFIDMVQHGEWDRLLLHKDVHDGDFVYIPACTIHAMCKNTLVYEIQQNSNLTFRLFDYHRKDEEGNERKLHLKEALETVSIPFLEEENKEYEESIDGQKVRVLASNPSFELTLIESNGNLRIHSKNTYSFISILEGSGSLNDHAVKMGDHLLALGDEEILFSGKLTAVICNEKKC